jgi:hypothetical protein
MNRAGVSFNPITLGTGTPDAVGSVEVAAGVVVDVVVEVVVVLVVVLRALSFRTDAGELLHEVTTQATIKMVAHPATRNRGGTTTSS